MNRFSLLLLLTATIAVTDLRAQSTDLVKQQAREFMYYDRYETALALLNNNRELRLRDKEGRFMAALCHYQLNQLEPAQEILDKLINEKNPYPECWLYKARIFHAQHRFEEASEQYKLYLKTISNSDPKRDNIHDAVRRCANGIRLQHQTATAVVESLEPLNTVKDEFGPILSPTDPSKLYFSSIRQGNIGGPRAAKGQQDDRFGQYRADIFFADRKAGRWSNPTSLHYLLNSPQHEVLLDVSRNGQVLYYFQGDQLRDGQLRVDTFRRQQRLASDPLISPVDPLAGISAPFFFSDTLIIFPSQRPGGYGGLDLYKTVKTRGRWTTPTNLGPEINSPYDETTPFLAPNGLTIYYSSNNSSLSLGGFDIIRAEYNPVNGRYEGVENLGMPINSAGDETHFRLSKDGYTAYFASSRKDGLGQRDLYAAYFFDYREEMTKPAAQTLGTSYQSRSTSEVASLNQPILPIYYNSQEEITKPDNRQKLEQIANWLIQHPDAKVLISACSVREMATTSRLYQAILATEKSAKLLREMGVPREQIFLEAYEALQSGPSLGAVDFFFSAEDSRTKPQTQISEFRMGFPLPGGLHYRLQFAQSEGAYQGSIPNKNLPIYVEQIPGERQYAYSLGHYPQFANAYTDAQRLQELFPNSLIITPYLEGKRLNPSESASLKNKYPDLEAWEVWKKKKGQ